MIPKISVASPPLRDDHRKDASKFIELAGKPNSMRRQKDKRFGFLEICQLVSARSGVALEGQFAHTRSWRKVDLIEPDPYKTGTGCVLEVINLVFLVRDRAPNGGRDVGLSRCADATRHADIAHNAEYGCDGLAWIGGLLDRVDIEARTSEAVRCAVCAGQHDRTADLLPVLVERKLLIVHG